MPKRSLEIFEVVHFITTIERGGAEKQLAYLVAEQKRQGYRVSIIYLKGKPELQDFLFSLEIPLIPIKGILRKKNLIRFLKILSKRRGIIYHAHLPRAEIFCFFAALFFYKPFVITRHNAENFIPIGSKSLSRILSRVITARASNTIAISIAVRDFLYHSGELYDSNKVRVVYYGFSNDTFTKVEHTKEFRVKNNDNFHLDQKLIVAISRLEPQKNLLRLIEGLAPFLKIRNQELHIYGDGSQRIRLQNEINSNGIANNTKLMGKTHDIAKVLESCDLFVLPSLYEGFGMVLFEALASNCRIAASSVSAIPEVLGFDYPYLFDPENTLEIGKVIQSCLDCKQEFFETFNKGRLEHFPISKTFLEIDSIYRSSLKEHSKGC